MKQPLRSLICCLLAQTAALHAADENFYWPGPVIGPATATKRLVESTQSDHILSNGVLAATFRLGQDRFRLVSLEDRLNHETLAWSDSNLFTLHLKGITLTSSSMRLAEKPKLIDHCLLHR